MGRRPPSGGIARGTIAFAALLASGPGFAQELASECGPPPATGDLAVGVVGCFKLPSAHMGGDVPVSYWIPEACDPVQSRTCPVLYYLHGTGGSYREGVGSKGSGGNAWVRALRAGPPVDPREQEEPWMYGPSSWVEKPPIDMILVSPHGRTLPGGFGHASNHDTGWSNWNPRYAKGGDQERYGTEAPRPSDFLVDELVPFVDATFPTVAHRQWRGILGYSQGGFGSYNNGLLHPDVWSSLGMQSGGSVPLVAPGDFADDSVLVTGVAPPAALPYLSLPGLVPTTLPDAVINENIVGEATMGFGDPIADQAWWRASSPNDQLPNARARGADGRQSVHLKHFVNDAVWRRAEDVTEFPDRYMATVFETVLHASCRYMEILFDRHEIERTFDVGPGHHWSPYQAPYFREQLEHQYANLRHWDGSIGWDGVPGDPAPRPDPEWFDYRTIRKEFTIWGWSFSVEREAVEYLNLTNVRCDRLTLRGTGVVTVTVPESCGTGLDGESTFTVDLGPSQPVDEPAGLGTSRTYGAVLTVQLE